MNKRVIKADEWQVKTIHTGLTQDRDKQGIHLTNPSDHEYEDALQTAHKDLFSTIYVHYTNVVRIEKRAA